MINILLSRYDISKKWCSKELAKYIKKGAKVVVLAFSFGDEISSVNDWEKYYGKIGVLSTAIEKAFKHYGVRSDDVQYINYFCDTPEVARDKLSQADIFFIPGGRADKFMMRAIEFQLYKEIEQHKGVVIGFGAGAQVQLAKFHVSDGDAKMCYSLGFRFIDGFDIEPDYSGRDLQDYFISRVIKETGVPVYAIGEEGAIIVDNGEMRIIGDVRCFGKKD